MSTGADCQFKEVEPGRWVYRLQRWPYGDSNEYDRFGPFTSFAIARDHLDQNHANPGGWMTTVHPTGHVHEWVSERGAYVPSGVEVTIRIESLGPNPTPAAILALIRRPGSNGGVTKDHLRIKQTSRYDESVITRSCEACGAEAPTKKH